jgi:hypothetical protein
MARRSLCIHVHAVRYEPIPKTRCRPSAETPFFCEVTNHTAANQSVNGRRERWKIVPAVTDVLCRHDRHNHNPAAVSHASGQPQRGQRNPSGQHSRAKYEAQAWSSGNQLVSCANVAG